MFDSFGNKVKIKSTAETTEKGLAGRIGEVFGQTTPSLMDFEVIGKTKKDFAINVHFEELKESFWFDEELLEFLDNGKGAEITLDGIDKKWIKEKDGTWSEENIKPIKKGKWWRFGK